MDLPPGSSENWHYIDADDEKQGPVPLDALGNLLSTAQIFPNTYVWNAVLMKDWAPYSEVMEAFPQLNPGSAGEPSQAPPVLDMPPPPADPAAPLDSAPPADFGAPPTDFGAPPADFGAPPQLDLPPPGTEPPPATAAPTLDLGPPPVIDAPKPKTLGGMGDAPPMDELDTAIADLRQQTVIDGDAAPKELDMGPPGFAPPPDDAFSAPPLDAAAPTQAQQPPGQAPPDFSEPTTEGTAHRMSIYQGPGGEPKGVTYDIDSEDTKEKVGRIVNRMAPYANEAADSQLQHLRRRQEGSDKGDVKRRGYLMKQGGNHKSWNKRWFVLRRNTIYYYKKERDSNPAGDILLEGATVETADRVTQKPFSIRVRRPDRQTYYLQAANMPEMEGWIESIKESIGPFELHDSISATLGRRYHDGFLKKQGGSHKNWRRRWCHMSKWFFYYFKHQQDQVPTGSIPLADFSAESASQKESSATYCIRLRAITRDFLFSAEDAEDRSMWQNGFAQALRDQRQGMVEGSTIRRHTGQAALLYDVGLSHPKKDYYCLDVSVFGCEWTIQARYAHLHALHQQLVKAFPGIVFPCLPPTEADEVYTKHAETADRERVVREAWLQCYFKELCENYEVSQHPAILRFLDLTNAFRAIREGLFHYVRYLIDELQVPLDQVDKEGETLLHASVLGGQHEITRFLLERGVSLRAEDQHKRTPLLCGVQGGYVPIVKTLKEFGASVNTPDETGTTPLLAAASLGFDELVEFLIDAHANTAAVDDEGKTALHCAVSNQHTGTVKLMLQSMQFAVRVADKQGFTPLHEAVEVGSDEIVELILGAKAEVDVQAGEDMRNRMPLHIAALSTHEKCVSIASRLITSGANLASQDGDGSTPLHLASWKGTVDMCRLLIKSGAPINFSDVENNVCTPLHLACNRGDADLVTTLVSLGANVHSRDSPDEEAPLHVAASKGFAELVDVLLDHEADTEARQMDGKTPLHLAVLARNDDAVQRLLERGAYPNSLDAKMASPLHYSVISIPGTTTKASMPLALMLARWGAMPTLQSSSGNTPMSNLAAAQKEELHQAALEGVRRVQEMQREAVQRHRQVSVLPIYHHPSGSEDPDDDSTKVNIEKVHTIGELLSEVRAAFGVGESGSLVLKYTPREKVRITPNTTIDEIRGHAAAIHAYPVKRVTIKMSLGESAGVGVSEGESVSESMAAPPVVDGEGVFEASAPPVLDGAPALDVPPPPM